MARTDTLTASITRFLKKNEKPVGACRVTPRGGVIWTAAMAGLGAVAGYTVATTVSEGALAVAIGGGGGAVVGVLLSSVVSWFRMRRSMGIRAAVVTLVLTPRRLLMFRQSWFANRVAELVGDIAIGEITSIVVGKGGMLRPHAVTVAVRGGEAFEFEAAKIENPEEFADAFRGVTGG